MVDLLMLGLIPGTNIQIDFEHWLVISSVLAAAILLFAAVKNRVWVARTCRPAMLFLQFHTLLFVLRARLAWRLHKTADMF